MTLEERIQTKIILEALKRYKKILKSYEGRKVLRGDGMIINILREELKKESEVIKNNYNTYNANIKGSFSLPRLFLSDHGSRVKGCFKINFCILNLLNFLFSLANSIKD